MTGSVSGLRVAVVGLGPMGRGIARVFAAAGAKVHVVDVDAAATAAGLERTLAEATEAGEPVELSAAGSPAEAAASVDLLVEAVVENMAVKRTLLTEVREAGDDRLVVASNTSSLSIGEMGQAFGEPSRLLGLHFFNPPTKMRLVEVVRGPHTSPEVLETARGWVEALGKTPVVCGDSPNFVVNRVCRPLYYEAQLLAAQGVAPAVVDAVARAALGHRMGPLELLDFTGLHTHLASSETALREFGDPRYKPIHLTRQLVRAGATGRAAGRGWYDHVALPPKAAREAVLRPVPGGGGRIRLLGPGAPALQDLAGSQVDPAAPVAVWSTADCSSDDVAAVRSLQAEGVQVVVDSSDGGWLDQLPAGAGWMRLHEGRSVPFAEVVHDQVAGIAPTEAVDAVLAAVGAESVEVLALPGLVADRLSVSMVNEAATVAEEGTAAPDDVDVALRLGMNHPWGPFEVLERLGEERVVSALRGLQAVTGDPRYRPALLLLRRAAGRTRT